MIEYCKKRGISKETVVSYFVVVVIINTNLCTNRKSPDLLCRFHC